MKSRWYDKSEKVADVLYKLRQLDENALALVTDNVLSVACSIKNFKRENDEVPVSLGLNRVLGLYQQNKSRRWYDKDSNMDILMRSIATLSEVEYMGMIEALDSALTSVKDEESDVGELIV